MTGAASSSGEAATGSVDIRLVALDYDLTILDHKNPLDTLHLQPWFERLAQQGVMVGIASGRSVDALRETMDDLEWRWADPFPQYVVAWEGEIYQPDGNDVPAAAAWNRQRRQRVKQANVELAEHFEKAVAWAEARGLTCIDPISTSPSGVNVVFKDPPEAEQVRQYLVEQLGDQEQYTIGRNHHIVLGLAATSGKGAALTRLAQIRNLEPRQVLAIGDSLNDWSMLCEDEGFTAATVSNGDVLIRNHLKANGGHIATKPISKGVIELFERFFPHCVA